METNRIASAQQPEPTLLDGAAVLLRWWKQIALIAAAVTLAAAAYAFLQPKSYSSRVVLVPSASGGGDARAQILAAQLKIPGLASAAGGSSSQMVVQAILNSGSLRDSLGARVRAGKEPVDAKTLGRVLRKGIAVESDPASRAITIDVQARDPKLAAAVAGHVPEVVNSIVGQLSLETAVRRREGLEKQLEDARRRLAASEDRLRAFQERNNIPDVQEQARQTVDALAEVRQKISEQEVRVAMLRRSTTPDNPQYRAAVAELEATRGQLARMGSGRNDVLLSRGALPEMRVELGRLMREYTKDEQVYLSLTAEMAGVQADASEEMTVVSVLDRPSVAEQPSSPRPKLLLMLGLMLGLALGVAFAFVADYLRRARAAPEYDSFFVEWDRIRGGTVEGRVAQGANGRGSSS